MRNYNGLKTLYMIYIASVPDLCPQSKEGLELHMYMYMYTGSLIPRPNACKHRALHALGLETRLAYQLLTAQ